MRSPVLAALAVALWAGSASAQVAVSGSVAHPASLTAADLAKFPAVALEMDVQTGHGRESASYTGALLWSVLDAAALVDEPGGRTHLRHTILARGRDGYAVSLALGEIDPEFEGKRVIVAYSQDGKPGQELRLVVPGDARGGRSVHDLVALEVR